MDFPPPQESYFELHAERLLEPLGVGEKSAFSLLGYEINSDGEELLEKSTSMIVDKLVDSMKEGKDNPYFFSSTLPVLGKYVTYLNKKMGVPNAHFYGAFRDVAPFCDLFITNCMDPSYTESNTSFLKSVEDTLKSITFFESGSFVDLLGMIPKGKSFRIQTKKGNSEFEKRFTVYSPASLPEKLKGYYEIHDALLPLDYIYLYVEQFRKINETFFPLTQTVFRFDFFPTEENCLPFLQQSLMQQGLAGKLIQVQPAIIEHPSYEMCEAFLQQMNALFFEILQTKNEKLIPLVLYEFWQFSPFIQGNQIIGEWIGRALYKFLEIPCQNCNIEWFL